MESDSLETLHNQDVVANFPCPEAEDIYPCTCFINEYEDIEMNCSGITSELDLANAFNATFPMKYFNKLTIENNKYLKKLKEGDLGNVSFEWIYITNTSLFELGNRSLSGSYSRLSFLQLKNNKISVFPFEELTLFENLYSLNLPDNAIQQLPSLVSSTLTELILDYNPLEFIPPDALKRIPLLQSASFVSCDISEIKSGTFYTELLQTVNLGYNYLTYIPVDAIYIKSSRSGLDLANNRISTMAEQAFGGYFKSVYLQNNLLEVFEENIFGPIVYHIDVYLEGNPLTCGCDMAWLVLNETLKGMIIDNPTCKDGTKFNELNPDFYEKFC